MYVYIYIYMLVELTRDLLLLGVGHIVKIFQDNETRYDTISIRRGCLSEDIEDLERSSFLFKSILRPGSFFPFVEGVLHGVGLNRTAAT